MLDSQDKMRKEVYIVESMRLPIGKANGIYKDTIPEVFTAHLLKYFLQKYPFLNENLGELILGNALGTGGNMARYAMLEAGFSVENVASTIDLQCASGLKAVMLGYNYLQSQNLKSESEINSYSHSFQPKAVLCGGFESNSLAPKRQYHFNDSRFVDELTFFKNATFAPSHFSDSSLIKAAENVAHKYNISKEEMIEWTVSSFKKANWVAENGFLKDSIVKFKSVEKDETFKKNITFERLDKSKTLNLIDHTNTAHLHDGACIHMLADAQFCKQNKIDPKFKIKAISQVGSLPNMAPNGPIWAIEKLLNENNLNISSIDLFEINESFAVKPLAFMKHFSINASKVNIFGGNLAYGHPFGASGAINLLHLIQSMKVSNSKTGIVAIGAAGGQGIALLIEKVKI